MNLKDRRRKLERFGRKCQLDLLERKAELSEAVRRRDVASAIESKADSVARYWSERLRFDAVPGDAAASGSQCQWLSERLDHALAVTMQCRKKVVGVNTECIEVGGRLAASQRRADCVDQRITHLMTLQRHEIDEQQENEVGERVLTAWGRAWKR